MYHGSIYPNIAHMISLVRPSRFSACNIEKDLEMRISRCSLHIASSPAPPSFSMFHTEKWEGLGDKITWEMLQMRHSERIEVQVSLLELSQDSMPSTHTFRMASKLKRSFLFSRASRAPSLALRLPNMVGYLQENTEWLQAYRFAEFYLPCSQVRIGFKLSPIFLIISCCFFILVKDVEHGFLFSGNLPLAILYQFWRTPLTSWL